MDLATLIGIVAGLGFISWGIMITGNLSAYFDIPSILIVLGGTFAATFIAFPMGRAIAIFRIAFNIFRTKLMEPQEIIQLLVAFAERARRDGLLALEEEAQQIDDAFLKKGIQLVVDGTDPELVRSILEIDLSFLEERHKEGKSIFEVMGALAPAFGMLGTLIGLIQMLRNLNEPELIGPNMAVALVTTFYGALLANLFFLPIANKLKIRSAEEILLKEVIIEGVLSIQAGENPRIIKEKLEAFLAPMKREQDRQEHQEFRERVIRGVQ